MNAEMVKSYSEYIAEYENVDMIKVFSKVEKLSQILLCLIS
ncbi:hypothetical protein CAXC1_180063 [Candidatus Xenohaliotis californiensis]|uniref:Uncharacterized protein n=1 Tax=Candidatus Xenohaliotis californiensis TaxID=84677 RepID=A0ABM9N7H4_9RICK|nr:hypothetical protein CAXC1_180063 [Candidatus Xenohaliotis californiensis]